MKVGKVEVDDVAFAAVWLLGYSRGLKATGNMDRPVAAAIRTAREIATGGAFNPLSVWEMQTVAKELMISEASP